MCFLGEKDDEDLVVDIKLVLYVRTEIRKNNNGPSDCVIHGVALMEEEVSNAIFVAIKKIHP